MGRQLQMMPTLTSAILVRDCWISGLMIRKRRRTGDLRPKHDDCDCVGCIFIVQGYYGCDTSAGCRTSSVFACKRYFDVVVIEKDARSDGSYVHYATREDGKNP